MNNIAEKEKKECCGCMACMAICPKNAINSKEDERGFFYPFIDTEKCINCGLCLSVCSFKKSYDLPQISINNICYAMKNKDIDKRMRSRSGGVFISLAENVIESGGVVYGAAVNEKLVVMHFRITDEKKLAAFQGSKYVQSDISKAFLEIESDLKNEKNVLFSGTPCQTSGLINFLKMRKINTEKLLVCDIVCHGVPSPKVWRDNVRYVEKINNHKIEKVNFRDKKYGWNSHIESYNDQFFSSLYTELFYSHLILRESCGSCKYTNFNRPSDITLADGWGLNEHIPDFTDNIGQSLVMVHTQKGKVSIDSVLNDFEYREVSKNWITENSHPNLFHPSVLPQNKERFWKEYNKKGYFYILKRYTSAGLFYKIKRYVRFKIKKIFCRK